MESTASAAQALPAKLTTSTKLSVWQAEIRRHLAAYNVERYVLEDVPHPEKVLEEYDDNLAMEWVSDRLLAQALIVKTLSAWAFDGLLDVGIYVSKENNPKTIYDGTTRFMSLKKSLCLPTHLSRLLNLKLRGSEQHFILPRAEGDTDFQYYLRLFIIHIDKLEESGCSMTDEAAFQLFLEGLPADSCYAYIDNISLRIHQGLLSWDEFQEAVLNGTEKLYEGCSDDEECSPYY